MNDRREYYSPTEINSIFARLDPQDVERFYQSYQLWTLQQQIAKLQTQITTLHLQIAENNERMQRSHPSAIALATLARLQSHGVTDIDLLDRMLARGEAWLDQAMQRLAYCEQFDFIRNNYTDWCQHALDGAYDWIDSLQDSSSSSPPEEPTSAARTDESLDEATEEKLLQKLMSDEEAFMLESTLKRPAIPAQPQKQAPSAEPAVFTQEEMIHSEFSDIPEESREISDSSHAPNEQATEVEHIEHTSIPGEFVPTHVDHNHEASLNTVEQAAPSEEVEVEPALSESKEPSLAMEQAVPSEEVEVKPALSESKEPSLANEEDIAPALEVPLPISDTVSSRSKEPLLSETNSFSHQPASRASAQRSDDGHLQAAKSRKKRSFLLRLIAVFFHR